MTIEERLASLEQAVLELRSGQGTVRADRFVLASKGKAPVGELSVTDDDCVTMALRGPNLAGGLQMNVDGESTNIIMLDRRNLPRVVISVSSKGEPRVSFTDGAGKLRSVIGVIAGEPAVVHLDEQGEAVWAAGRD